MGSYPHAMKATRSSHKACYAYTRMGTVGMAERGARGGSRERRSSGVTESDRLRCAGCGKEFGDTEVVIAEVAERTSLQIASISELAGAPVRRAWHAGCIVVGDE